MQPGDIAQFEVRKGRNHLGYLVGDGSMVHCNQKAGVVQSRIDDKWAERLLAVWRWNGLWEQE